MYQPTKTVIIRRGCVLKPANHYSEQFLKDNKVNIDDLIKQKLLRGIASPNNEPKEVVSHTSPWCLDPKALANKHIDILNILIKERDPKAKVYDTAAEAIAKLSRDFVED